MNDDLNPSLKRLHPYELVLFAYPSAGLDWRTPRALAFSILRAKLKRSPRRIGHVSVLLRSPDEAILTGMTQRDPREGQKEVLRDAHGFGILFRDFKGTLERAEALAPELEYRSAKNGALSYLRIRLAPETHARLRKYVTEFRDRNFGARYGMKNRPRYGEGSGCSAFAASFLELAGLLTPELEKAWTRRFRVPHSLIGGPGIGGGRRVRFLDLLTRAHQWATENERYEEGYLWDPDLMHAWMEETHRLVMRGEVSAFTAERWNSAVGLGWDASDQPTPTGPLFHTEN